MNKIILLLSFVLAFAFNVSAETQTERERIYARTVGKEDANFRRYVRLNNSLRSMKKGLASSEKRLAEGNFKHQNGICSKRLSRKRLSALRKKSLSFKQKLIRLLLRMQSLLRLFMQTIKLQNKLF